MSFSSTKNNSHNINNNDNMANSSSDFVSADVNEMPQDARQILTNREQRHDGQHPNEWELDESTTLRVTKQDGDEDQMEVTVLQKRLVKQEESETEDTDKQRHNNDLWQKQDLTASEREEMATARTINGEKTTTINGHSSASIAEEKSQEADGEESSSEDAVQMKVEIAEQCQQQEGKGTQFVEQMIAVMGLATIVVSFWDKFYDKLYRPLRAGIFSCIGLNGNKVTQTSTTMTMDLPRHRKLPAELDREIFLFLKPAAQRKFIWGLNWDFYAMFRYRLLTKSKRVRNPTGNRWNDTNTTATIAADGLHVSNKVGAPNVFATQSFPISLPICRMDDFPGTILYYYEVKTDLRCIVGLSGAIPDDSWIGPYSNSYATVHYYGCWLAGMTHRFELPEGAIRPKGNIAIGSVNVYGCGLVLDPDNKLEIFFTMNGQLLGRKIPISPTVDRLFPAVTIWNESSAEANFGDDPAKPFEYDIQKCTGLGLACV